MATRPDPDCVLKVGTGRGFIIECRHRRLVVTAAHCLTEAGNELPPCDSSAGWKERTYPNILGRLCGKQNVWAECLFVDPVADIAVLGTPDYNALDSEDNAYQKLTAKTSTLSIANPRSGRGWLLSLGEKPKWIPTKLDVRSTPCGAILNIGPTKNGMSGSPIVDNEGQAIGVVVISMPGQSVLTRDLPGRFLEVQVRR